MEVSFPPPVCLPGQVAPHMSLQQSNQVFVGHPQLFPVVIRGNFSTNDLRKILTNNYLVLLISMVNGLRHAYSWEIEHSKITYAGRKMVAALFSFFPSLNPPQTKTRQHRIIKFKTQLWVYLVY